MTATPRSWCALAADAGALGVDAWTVVTLRLVRLAGGGPGAAREARRMVEEKLIAHNEFAQAIATGKAGATPRALADSVLAHYGPLIRANRRRLVRSCTGTQSG